MSGLRSKKEPTAQNREPATNDPRSIRNVPPFCRTINFMGRITGYGP